MVTKYQSPRDLQCAWWGTASPVEGIWNDLPLNPPWPPSYPPICLKPQQRYSIPCQTHTRLSKGRHLRPSAHLQNHRCPGLQGQKVPSALAGCIHGEGCLTMSSTIPLSHGQSRNRLAWEHGVITRVIHYPFPARSQMLTQSEGHLL